MPSILKITRSTWLKRSPAQSDKLGPDQKISALAGVEYPVANWEIDRNHYSVRTASPIDGCDRWFIFVEHAQIWQSDLVTAEQLIAIAGSDEWADRIHELTPGVNETLSRYKITTPLRIAHFLAQVLHESGRFRYLREIWGPTPDQESYEDRGEGDLGNTQPGDGKRFMGRGLIQLTGRANYAAFSAAIGVDFVANPELVERSPYAVMAAGWFWDSNGINQLADLDCLESVTRRINGGTNGIEDRGQYLDRAKAVLGVKPGI